MCPIERLHASGAAASACANGLHRRTAAAASQTDGRAGRAPARPGEPLPRNRVKAYAMFRAPSDVAATFPRDDGLVEDRGGNRNML